MENRGLEPLTLGLQSRCSKPTELIPRLPFKHSLIYNSQLKKKDSFSNLLFATLLYTNSIFFLFLKKEVIQPHLPVRLPCYDFTPLTNHTLESGPSCELSCLLRVSPARMV